MRDHDTREAAAQRYEPRHEAPPRELRRSGDPSFTGPGGPLEDFLLQRAGMLLLILLLVTYKILSTGHVSARIVNGEPPEYDVEEIPGILWRFMHDPTNPKGAFEPVNRGGEVPNGVGYWATFAVLLAFHIAVGIVIYRWIQRRRRKREEDPVKRRLWADDEEARELLRTPKDGAIGEDVIVVGQHGKQLVTIGRLDSLLLLGPPHSGKTGAVSVPALLTWDGPALVASTRGRTLDETIGWRKTQGHVRVFDPAAITRHERSGWALLSSCGHREGAIHMAQHLASAAYGSAGGRIAGGASERLDQGALWGGAMAMALAPYLYAAAATGRPIIEVAEWLEREERDEVHDILAPIDSAAAHALETALSRDDPTRSTFFHHMYQLLSVYADPTVAASATKNDIAPADLLNGQKNTLYLTAAEHDQNRFQPLFATIVRQTLAAANNRYMAGGYPLHPPLLVVVDGAVGVASIQLLSQMSSTGADKGVETVSIFNDVDWYDALEGNATETLLNNHRALLVLHRGRMGDSDSPSAGIWAEVGHELEAGEAALFYRDKRPLRLRLRRWREDEGLVQRVDAPQEALPPDVQTPLRDTPPAVKNPPEYKLVDQASAWGRRGGRRGEGEGVSSGGIGGKERRGQRLNVFRGSSTPEMEGDEVISSAGLRRRYRPED